MNCLCCNKPLDEPNSLMWHKNCIKSFFGTTTIPTIDLSDQELKRIASENVKSGLTIPGVQKKLSLHLSSNGKNHRLTIVNYPTEYIIKPSNDEYKFIVESEHLVMSMADYCGIKTVPHGLIRNNDSYIFITKRIDRKFNKDVACLIAMEDFCQLCGRLTEDKYKGSYEKCAKIIQEYSHISMYDITELFIRLVFCFLIGNSDMHLKNFSLIEDENGNYSLSPAYDLLPVNLLIKEDNEEFALSMNGKKNNIKRKDFLIFAESCGISKVAAEKMILSIKTKVDYLIEMCNESLLPTEMKEDFIKLIKERCSRL